MNNRPLKTKGDNRLERSDWALLVAATGGSQPTTPVQLQKILFLADRNLPRGKKSVRHFYSFEAYDYGPFCKDIYSDMEQLAREGLISIETVPGRSFKLYKVTDAGKSRATRVKQQLDAGVVKYVEDLSAWARKLSFNELVSFVYKRYPEMKVNSVFQSA